MNEPTHKTYSFSNFQELVDRVPSNRISECMRELGIVLGQGKATTELLYAAAQCLAKNDGVDIPDITNGRVIDVPSVIEWVDDGKGELEAGITMPSGEELIRVKLS